VAGDIVLATTATIRGGVWRHIEDLGLGLQRAGLNVAVGLRPDATELQGACEVTGLRWEPLRRSLERRSVDMWHVHLHDSFDTDAFKALLARRLHGRAMITEHLPRNHASDDRLEQQYPRTRFAAEAKFVFKRVEFRLAARIIAVGSSSAAFLHDRYKLPVDRITVVHNGVPVPASPAAPRRDQDGALRVVTVGTLGRQKGPDVLVEAVRRSQRNWKVIFVGSGPQLEQLRAAAATLPPGRVEFAGWVDNPQLHVLGADVFCMPSRWESFPYAALEACALARPVVASRVDGLDEIVEDGVTGILVPPDRPAALAGALDRLAAEPRLVEAYGRAAYDRVRTHFGLDAMVQGVLAAYQDAQLDRL
jgi:glycosyltransferase involved in cell wall biosynthesis